MKKKSIAIYVSSILCAITLCMGFLFMFKMPRAIQVSAEEYALESQTNNEDADFEKDSIIIVLKSESSRFRGISDDIREKIYSIGGKAIKDLSALPARYVNIDGSINENEAPSLYSHYQETAFKQILYVKLLSAGKDRVLDAIEAVKEFEEVDYVGPNWIEETGTFIPNDTYYSQQWALKSYDGINAESAWNITRGNNKIRVGIIDSGIATDSDLSANIQTGYDFYTDNDVTNDPLGGHGTHVAGIVAAVGNNSMGISGVAPNVKLVPLQTAFDTAGSGNHHTSERLEAINYATSLWEDEDQRISILNHSIAGFGTNTDIAAAVNNYPGLFVWSAGNDHTDTDTFSQINSFKLPNVISVGALTSTGQRASFSNYGQNSVSIYA